MTVDMSGHLNLQTAKITDGPAPLSPRQSPLILKWSLAFLVAELQEEPMVSNGCTLHLRSSRLHSIAYSSNLTAALLTFTRSVSVEEMLAWI